MNSSRKLELGDIVDMRAYERDREALRNEVIEVKRRRRIGLGTLVTIMFENRATIKSQIHEMLRAEKIGTDDGVIEQLKAYNPLIPEVGQLCATLFIELTNEAQMREWLAKLFGIENSIVFKLSDGSLVRSIAEEGHAETLTRDNVTAAVHYLRFEFTPDQVALFDSGGAQILCDLPAYLEVAELPPFMVTELLLDLR